jgi:hypothetical protein
VGISCVSCALWRQSRRYRNLLSGRNSWCESFLTGKISLRQWSNPRQNALCQSKRTGKRGLFFKQGYILQVRSPRILGRVLSHSFFDSFLRELDSFSAALA